MIVVRRPMLRPQEVALTRVTQKSQNEKKMINPSRTKLVSARAACAKFRRTITDRRLEAGYHRG